MKMNKNVKVGLGVAVFCIVISMFACSDKSAEIGNNVDQELAEQYPDKAVDPPADGYVAPKGDFESAKELKIKSYQALGLPGKIFPKNAGEIVKKVIYEIIEEKNL